MPALLLNPCSQSLFCGQSRQFTSQSFQRFVDELGLSAANSLLPNSIEDPPEPVLGRLNILTASTSSNEPKTNFGSTNNQEVKVDEADLLKTDGQYIYTHFPN